MQGCSSYGEGVCTIRLFALEVSEPQGAGLFIEGWMVIYNSPIEANMFHSRGAPDAQVSAE